jgi:hypothetical protein
VSHGPRGRPSRSAQTRSPQTSAPARPGRPRSAARSETSTGCRVWCPNGPSAPDAYVPGQPVVDRGRPPPRRSRLVKVQLPARPQRGTISAMNQVKRLPAGASSPPNTLPSATITSSPHTGGRGRRGPSASRSALPQVIAVPPRELTGLVQDAALPVRDAPCTGSCPAPQRCGWSRPSSRVSVQATTAQTSRFARPCHLNRPANCERMGTGPGPPAPCGLSAAHTAQRTS